MHFLKFCKNGIVLMKNDIQVDAAYYLGNDINLDKMRQWFKDHEDLDIGVKDMEKEIIERQEFIATELEAVMIRAEHYGEEGIYLDSKDSVMYKMIDLLRKDIEHEGYNFPEEQIINQSAAFVYACLNWDGCEVPPAPSKTYPNSYGYCVSYEYRALIAGIFHKKNPRRGDIVLFNHNHMGFVSRVERRGMHTILYCTEGNGNQGMALRCEERDEYEVKGYIRVFDDEGRFIKGCLG